MKLPTISRLVVEDFPKEIQGWAGKLFEPLNTFMGKMKSGLDKSITVNDNLSGQIRTLQVKNVSASSPVSFSYKSSRSPQVVVIGGIYNKDNPTESLTNAVSLQWSYDGKGTITIKNVPGLTADKNYLLTLLILDD
jgi:hypothetical protein